MTLLKLVFMFEHLFSILAAREIGRGGKRRIKSTACVEAPSSVKAFRHCSRGYNLARGFERARNRWQHR